MSDHNERACFKCGSFLHHEDDCKETDPVECRKKNIEENFQKCAQIDPRVAVALSEYRFGACNPLELALKKAIVELVMVNLKMRDELVALHGRYGPVPDPIIIEAGEST